jgi:hypothetical protein
MVACHAAEDPFAAVDWIRRGLDLKGRGFPAAPLFAKSMAALAAEGVCTLLHSKLCNIQKEKAPSTFQSRTPRQPSPRTAKPRIEHRFPQVLCKRHFGNGISRKLIGALTKVTVSIPVWDWRSAFERARLQAAPLQPGKDSGALAPEGYCFCHVCPASDVVQVSEAEVITLPCCGSGNSSTTTSPVRAAPPDAGTTCIQWSPLSVE